MVTTTLRTIGFDEALQHLDDGAALIDLRDAPAYLDVHIPGSLDLVYEFGPGMAGRARDCIPLSVPLVLIRSEDVNMLHSAASLRGKGFNVLGQVGNALNRWSEGGRRLASSEFLDAPVPPDGRLIDVEDPGRRAHEGAESIPIEELWDRSGELKGEGVVTVLCGRGVRAALAVGMLERIGVPEVRLWRNPA
jgi:rhodanese-related sulfurtransferase